MASTDTESSGPEKAGEKDEPSGRSTGKIAVLLPGLAVVIMIAALSIWLSSVIGVTLLGFEKTPLSPVMLAVVLGLLIGSVVPRSAEFQPGFAFAVKRILRLGVIMLGIRLTIVDLLYLGAYGIPIVVICFSSSLLITTQIGRWLKLPERLGALIAVGTSICGVSAILAAGPAIDADDEEVAYAVAVITIFGLVATVFYPFIAHTLFGGDALQAGLFIGTAVHDTSQVAGAAKVYADVFSAPLALDVAMVAKLVRNSLMAIVIPFLAFHYGRKGRNQDDAKGKQTRALNLVPLFILGFVTMAAIRSIGDVMVDAGGHALGLWDAVTWKSVYSTVQTWAGHFLVVALAGVGLSTRVAALRGLGIKPLLVGLGAALMVGVFSFAAISLLDSLVL